MRFDGNSEELTELAKVNAMALGAGHTFIVFLDGGFPVNCLNAVKSVTEVGGMPAGTGCLLMMR